MKWCLFQRLIPALLALLLFSVTVSVAQTPDDVVVYNGVNIPVTRNATEWQAAYNRNPSKKTLQVLVKFRIKQPALVNKSNVLTLLNVVDRVQGDFYTAVLLPAASLELEEQLEFITEIKPEWKLSEALLAKLNVNAVIDISVR
ncbi:MAG: hypothetical protein K0R82_2288 [Flavipsychrobacter sp.]|nr:hypothetical protein [Flavipsychrobacter sp.]